ncbi:hypothetical protein ACQ859_23760 [Roseateles chitinivorans]|uniref:hypothetical protein n=1 Tax=Roseateles chitinivorans TaxID=2917965 RepID=UPI003D67B4BD
MALKATSRPKIARFARAGRPCNAPDLEGTLPAAFDGAVVERAGPPGPPEALGFAATDPVVPVDVPALPESVGTTGPPVVSLEETIGGAAS